MGFGDGFYKQVPDNIVLDTSSPLFDNIVDNAVSLYVSTTGDDTYGDGSESNPYATPQRAVDSIPKDLEKMTTVYIMCGAGNFKFPNTENAPAFSDIQIFGNMKNPVFSFSVGSVTFSPVSGKKARYAANIGAYSDTITDGSHWAFLEWSLYIPRSDEGFIVTNSSSPNIEIISGYDPVSIIPVTIYEYETTFEIEMLDWHPNAFFGGNNRVKMIGIDIVQIGSSFTRTVTFKNISLLGCKITDIRLTIEDDDGYDYNTIIYTENNLTSNSVYGSLIKGQLLTPTTETSFGYANYRSNVVNKISTTKGKVDIYDSDFEGSGDCITYQNGSSLRLSNNSVQSTKTSFITKASTHSGFCFIDVYGTITGAVTGNAVTLANGTQAKGIATYCAGTLTAGGSEIIVGALTGQTFSSLPANDLANPNTQICRAE